MTQKPGTRLGPYEILGPLGAGGMGEVYRARDPRLGREVALKVLPAGVAGDPERQKRFEAEARAAGALNHPNIVTVHDVGVADGAPFLVTELLEGETLEARLRAGPIRPRAAARLVAQVATGLSEAHAKGIVHRDLKPANLFVLPDDRVKILDFGIAKLLRAESEATEETTPVFASLTAAGAVVGTVSYMAPEQLRDRAVDQRADLFALGAILYETVSGRLAFPGETAADRITAILSTEPAPLPPDVEAGLPGLGALIRRCLEKRPATRFESARDLAYALEALETAAAARGTVVSGEGPPVLSEPPELSIRQLTFREGSVSRARFAPDGTTVVYRAAWEGNPSDLYLARTDNPDYRSLRLENTQLFSISSGAELAIGSSPRHLGGFITLHTLARVSMLGGVPRELARDVFMADWAPDGKSIAAIRCVDGRNRLEYPLGRVVHETTGWLSCVRVSPDGALLAFFEHPIPGDNAGHLMLLAPGRSARRLVQDLPGCTSIAWHPARGEVWYCAAGPGGLGLVRAATQDGQIRRVYQSFGWPDLQDISSRGEALVCQTRASMRLQTGSRGSPEATELSWMDWSLAGDISPDGSTVLFDESGPSTGHSAVAFTRTTDGAPAVRIAEGGGMAFMPGGGHVLTVSRLGRSLFVIHPIGPGEPRTFSVGDVQIHSGWPLPDGTSVVFVGSRPGEPAGLYRLDLGAGACTLMTREPISLGLPIPSPDGRSVAARDSEGRVAIYPVDGGPAMPVPGIEAHERVCGFRPDGGALYVFVRGTVPAIVTTVELDSGRRQPWLSIVPVTRSGVEGLNNMVLTPDGERYAASFVQGIGNLYVVGGLE